MSTISTAYNSGIDSCCAKVVVAIDQINSSANVAQPTGVLNALISPENKGTFELVLDPNKDRPTEDSFRKVYTKDVAPVCNQDTTADSACATPTFTPDTLSNAYIHAEHEINSSIKREIVLDLNGFKAFCVNPTEYIANRLLAFRAGVWAEINTKLISTVAGYVGAYADQTSPANSISAPKSVSFLTPGAIAGFSFDPTGYGKIKDEFAKLGYAYEAPIVVGGSQLSVLQSNAGYYTGANLNGVVGAAIPNLYVDYGVDTYFGDGINHAITWKPGAVQVATVNDISDAMIQLSIPNQRERMRVASPFGDPFTWDFYFDIDATGCQYKLKWQLWFDALLPVPYDGTCAKKPVLNFTINCDGNTCPDSSFED